MTGSIQLDGLASTLEIVENRYLAYAKARNVYFYDIDNLNIAKTITARSSVKSIKYTSDNFLITLLNDNSIQVWQGTSLIHTRTYPLSILKTFDHIEDIVAVGYSNGTIDIWNKTSYVFSIYYLEHLLNQTKDLENFVSK